MPLRPPHCPAQGSGPPCPHHVLPAPALTFLTALANLLFMQQVPDGRTACFHPRLLPPRPSSTLPGTAPVCEAQGGHAEPWLPPERGSHGGGSTPAPHSPSLPPLALRGSAAFRVSPLEWGQLVAVPKGRGAAWPAAPSESGWAYAGARRSQRSQASFRASPACPAAGPGTVTVPSPLCWDAWQHPCQGRGHWAALPLHCPRDASGTQRGYCTAKSHHCARDVPQAGTDPIPSVSPPICPRRAAPWPIPARKAGAGPGQRSPGAPSPADQG